MKLHINYNLQFWVFLTNGLRVLEKFNAKFVKIIDEIGNLSPNKNLHW